ncbi:hypothetical protein [Rubellimicrobium roseum]|uniref:Outer membrane beta-barrel protein n=1 Tax=Rubellimicrobium roseum TaxID=687525 RepID=A0A5C4NJ43_9RHOB|nr:hypothetical protein [Rubellimicrobium roseum]TNC74801.1 hypothetical protein FHG71_01325 [Rubellimicrobium roseum]
MSLSVLAAAGLGLAPLALAQDAAGRTPNPLLTFTLSQGLGAERNANLDPGSDEVEARSNTDVALAFETRTPVSTLSLGTDATLDLPLSGDGDRRVRGPQLRFDYDRTVPSASLSLSGRASETDVAFLRTLGDFVDDDGTIDLPDDFADFRGEGTRRNLRLDGDLSLRDNAPLGVILSAGTEVTDYSDVTSSDLVDFQETTFGAALRFRLTEVAEVTAGLRGSTYDEDGADPVTRYGFDLAGAIERRDGQVSAQLTLDETDDGTRAALSFGRAIERRTLQLSGSLGVTRDGTGDLELTGSLQATRELANGSASVALDQSVETVEGNDEKVVTTVSANYARALTPVASLSVDALFGRSQDTGSDESTRTLEVGATLSRQVTEDWDLSLGLRARQRDETGAETARGQDLFLTLGRSFRGGF